MATRVVVFQRARRIDQRDWAAFCVDGWKMQLQAANEIGFDM